MSETIEGVENMDGTSGPRWVIPMSGVVVMVISSAIPGSKPDFNGRLLSVPVGTNASTSDMDDGCSCDVPRGDCSFGGRRRPLRNGPDLRPRRHPFRLI